MAIGLLEISSNRSVNSFEKEMLSAFLAGPILAAFSDSSPSEAGLGRLTNAVEKFIGLFWINGETSPARRGIVFNILQRWQAEIISRKEVRRKKMEPCPEIFLEKFAEIMMN